MTKYFKIEFLLLSLAGGIVIYHFYISPISLNKQMIILLTLSLLIGVPHGALDFLVDKQVEEVDNKVFSIKKFVLIYMGKFVLFGLCWVFPWLAFSLFMLLSIYHFGETDMFPIMKKSKSSMILNVSFGFLIMSILIGAHLGEIQAALPIIPSYFFTNDVYCFFQTNAWILILCSLIVFFLAFYINYKKGVVKKITLSKVFEFLILFLLLYKLPILLAFTFYFAIWHAALSVRNIFSYFRSFNSVKSFNVICVKSLLFSVFALLGIVITYFVLLYFSPNINMLFALLVVLSLLTLPHLMVMHNMYTKFSGNYKMQ